MSEKGPETRDNSGSHPRLRPSSPEKKPARSETTTGSADTEASGKPESVDPRPASDVEKPAAQASSSEGSRKEQPPITPAASRGNLQMVETRSDVSAQAGANDSTSSTGSEPQSKPRPQSKPESDAGSGVSSTADKPSQKPASSPNLVQVETRHSANQVSSDTGGSSDSDNKRNVTENSDS